MADVFLGLGSNLGDKVANIKKAIGLLEKSAAVKITGSSSIYEGEPMGLTGQPDFINCVIRAEIDLEPHDLLAIIKSIEAEMGRRPDTHMRPRPIDIDILMYNDLDMESFDLMIPHSRLKTRRFALQPLLEIDPDVIDSSTGKPLREFLKDVASQRLKLVLDAKEVWDVPGRSDQI